MAEVSNVLLDIQYPTIGPGPATVKVQGKLTFAPQEQGKSYKLRIGLFGKDPEPGETGPIVLGGEPVPIYMFRWGSTFLTHDHKVINATPGTQDFVETRDVPMTKLDEDPETWKQVISGLTMLFREDDEVFATVSLASEQSTNVVELKYVPTPV